MDGVLSMDRRTFIAGGMAATATAALPLPEPTYAYTATVPYAYPVEPHHGELLEMRLAVKGGGTQFKYYGYHRDRGWIALEDFGNRFPTEEELVHHTK